MESSKKVLIARKPDVEIPDGVEEQMPVAVAKTKKVASESTLIALKRGREIRAAKLEAKKSAQARIEPMKPKEEVKTEPIQTVVKKRKQYATETIKSELAEMKALLKEKAVPVPPPEPVVPVVKEVVREVVKERLLTGSALLDTLFNKH